MVANQASTAVGAVIGPDAVELGDKWALGCGDWAVEVDAKRGARISAFSLKGRNLLTGPEVDAVNFGSTFWTSPQSDWDWPPVAAVDSNPYAVVEGDAGLVCCGSPSAKLGIIVTKRFWVVPASDSLLVEYEMSNQSVETLRYAPWEVSRVRGGLTFFGSGQGPLDIGDAPSVRTQQFQGTTFFQYRREEVTEDQKLYSHADGGYLAHIDDGIALIKSFDVVAADKQAPGEGAVEIFASGSKDYVEIEQQGAYQKIGPWKSVKWRVAWAVRAVPQGIAVRAGNSELVDWARSEAPRI